MTKVAVIGAGSWGTSASWLLGGKGHEVTMWAREAEIADGINAAHANPMYMKDIVLPDSVTATSDIERALSGAEAVVMVTPSMGVRSTADSMSPFL
ncbi:MAG TPA: 2-dehydropantoate 2-reductase N-terminal domain-containing protein, partial [Coriobacteriia bacterium]